MPGNSKSHSGVKGAESAGTRLLVANPLVVVVLLMAQVEAQVEAGLEAAPLVALLLAPRCRPALSCDIGYVVLSCILWEMSSDIPEIGNAKPDGIRLQSGSLPSCQLSVFDSKIES